jgi:plastocyanin
MLSRNEKLLIVFGVVTAIIIFALNTVFFSDKKEDYVWSNEIRITENGFEPNSIAVLVGQTIVFINETGKDSGPASDFHPSHLIYQDFDSKKPLVEGESWSFGFDKEGVWSFHDHLRPSKRGTVYVLPNKNSIPKKLTKEICDKGQSGLDYSACLGLVVENVMKEEGLKAGLDLFYKSKNMISDCHDLAHKVGEAAYLSKKDGESVDYGEITNLCNWGFWHGFSTKYVEENGLDYDEVEEFCKTIDSYIAPQTDSNCFHGIGIGLVPDPPNPKVWGNFEAISQLAVSSCDVFKRNNQHYSDCLGGAFHALVDFIRKDLYGLNFDKNDPFKICKILNYSETEKMTCYSQAVQFVLQFGGDALGFTKIFLNSDEVIKNGDIKNIGHLISLIFFGQINYRKSLSLPIDNKSLIEICNNLGDKYRIYCVKGFARGFIQTGDIKDKEYLSSARLCSDNLLTTKEKTYCMENVSSFMTLQYSPSDLDDACTEIKDKFNISCTN